MQAAALFGIILSFTDAGWFGLIRKKLVLYSLLATFLFYIFYEYPKVGTTLFKADITSFKLFPELVKTNIT